MARKPTRCLLLSLPWADYTFPSLKIGAVAAYARRRGHDCSARHLHLETAAEIGLDRYARVVLERCGEDYAAALLFPGRARTIVRRLGGDAAWHRATIRLLSASLADFLRRIPWRRYDVIGFTVDIDQLFTSLLLAREIKARHPKIKIVMGGACASGELGASILRCFPQADWCINGEGELPLAALLDAIARGEGDFEADLPGLISRSNGGIRINPRAPLEDLGGLPDPDFDHYYDLLERHPALAGRSFETNILIEGGRGCTHRCAFCACSTHVGNYRRRPAAEIAAQMQRLANRYRNPRFVFADLRTHPKGDAELFRNIAQQGRDYEIFYEFRADMDRPLLTLMREAGVRRGQIGIEALCTGILRKMRKGTRFIENLQVLKLCTELGIRHQSNIILGFPSETQGEIDESTRNIGYALAYRPPLQRTEFALLTGSPAWASPKRFGIARISGSGPIVRLLPPPLRAGFASLQRDFMRDRQRPRYARLIARHRDWVRRYEESVQMQTPLLQLFDCGDFLRIEDRRAADIDITLDGAIREIYLFCDSIRSFKEIRKRFPKVPERELRKVLRKLFKLKVMYTEDDDWLSLAIHAAAENRRHMPFL